MRLNEAETILKAMKHDLKRIAAQDEFDLEDYNNLEERFIYQEYMGISHKLKDIVQTLEYLEKPVIAEGNLAKRSDGRYEIIGTDIYFTSGSPIEIWDEDWNTYSRTRIEHRNDYYAVGYGEKSLEGLKVRVR